MEKTANHKIGKYTLYTITTGHVHAVKTDKGYVTAVTYAPGYEITEEELRSLPRDAWRPFSTGTLCYVG